MGSPARVQLWEARFLVVSLVVVALLAYVAQGLVSSFVTERVLWVEAQEAEDDMRVMGEALALFDWSRPLGPDEVAAVDLVVQKSLLPILLLKVWSADGTVLYSTEHALIGQTFPPSEGLRSALSGRPAAELTDLAAEENELERTSGLREALEAYIPIVVDGRVVGAFETYSDASPLTQALAGLRRRLAVVFLFGAALLWAALWLLAHGMATNLRRQNRDLARLGEELEASLRRSQETLDGTLAALAEAVEAKDEYVGGHVGRVAAYADMIAEELGLAGPAREDVRNGAVLHDIGKMAIPDAILGKPGPLSPTERTIMETHSLRGEAIVRRVPALEGAALVVRHHHERWDGAGYPDGLAGAAIPLGARIVAVADAFDAMTTDRVYRKALSYEEALKELAREAGRQFDPQVVLALRSGLMKLARQPEVAVRVIPRQAAEAALAGGD